MKNTAVAGTLVLAFAACLVAVAQESRPPDDADPLAGPGKLRPLPSLHLNEDIIRNAVRETIKESKAARREPAGGGVLSAGRDNDPYTKFGRQFSEAQVPGCIGPDPLKHVPTSTVIRSKTFGDWLVGVGGVFAAPFWGYAVLSGKCK